MGFVARELLGQSAAVRITGTQGFDGKPLGRSRHRWEDLRMGLNEVRKRVAWVLLAQNRDQWHASVNAIVNRWVP